MTSASRTILASWLLAATLDISAASVYYPIKYGISVTTIYQGIASGVFGESAFTGGTLMAGIGLALHYAIALIWSLLFFFAFPKIGLRGKNRAMTAAGFGIFVWCVMNLVVLPLSRVNPSPIRFFPAAIAAGILIVCIGVPNAIITGRYYARPAAGSQREIDLRQK